MGAWGHGVFEDDTALDFMDELMGHSDPRPIMAQAFGVDGESGLDYEQGHAVLVSALVMRSVEDKEPLEEDEDPDWTRWRQSLEGLDFSRLYGPAVRSLQHLIGPNSELNELWAENEEDYPLWRQQAQDLLEWVISGQEGV